MKVERGFFWAPRVLGVLFVAFLSMFALDVFGEGLGFWETVLALVIHLIPALVVLALLAIAWRWEVAGGVLFLVLGATCLVAPLGPKDLIISGPPMVLGILFLAHWAHRARHPLLPWDRRS